MKIIRKNLNFLLLAAGVVLVWRGVWGFADMFLFPNSKLLSFGLSIVLGVLILYLLNPKQKDISELL